MVIVVSATVLVTDDVVLKQNRRDLVVALLLDVELDIQVQRAPETDEENDIPVFTG